MNIFQEAKQILDKDGKVNALGPYGKSKLTGSEIASYFRKNKVSDPQVKKAVEVALDLGGAYDVAAKEIKKFYGDKILKSKEVQQALRFANESVEVCEGILFREYEPGEFINGEEKRFVDLIKKNGGKNISVEKPTRREPNLHIEFEGGNLKNMQKDLKRIDDGLTSLEEVVAEGKLGDSIIRKDFPNVWAASARDREILKKFHAKVDTSNYKQQKDLYRKDIEGFIDSLNEGTMAIGIFDNNPSEKKKAIAGMQKLLKGKRNVKVGSPEGQKIGRELDLKYLSDDELADDFARPSNKNMTIQDLLKKHEKRFNIKFEEKESVMDSYRKMWEDAEQVDEGKYKKYADLLMKKADMLKKGMDTMQVDKELDKEFENITGKRAVKGHSFRD